MSPEITVIVWLSPFIGTLIVLLLWIVASARMNTDLDEAKQERIERERLPIPRYRQERRS